MAQVVALPQVEQSTRRPEVIERIEESGRVFVLRKLPEGRFRYEVVERVEPGLFIDPAAFRLLALGRGELRRRVIAARPLPRLLPIITAPHEPDKYSVDRLQEQRELRAEAERAGDWS